MTIAAVIAKESGIDSFFSGLLVGTHIQLFS